MNTFTANLEREFWERVVIALCHIESMPADDTAEFADALLNEWRKRFAVYRLPQKED